MSVYICGSNLVCTSPKRLSVEKKLLLGNKKFRKILQVYNKYAEAYSYKKYKKLLICSDIELVYFPCRFFRIISILIYLAYSHWRSYAAKWAQCKNLQTRLWVINFEFFVVRRMNPIIGSHARIKRKKAAKVRMWLLGHKNLLHPLAVVEIQWKCKYVYNIYTWRSAPHMS